MQLYVVWPASTCTWETLSELPVKAQVIKTKRAESSNEPRFSSKVQILGKQIYENNVIDP